MLRSLSLLVYLLGVFVGQRLQTIASTTTPVTTAANPTTTVVNPTTTETNPATTEATIVCTVNEGDKTDCTSGTNSSTSDCDTQGTFIFEVNVTDATGEPTFNGDGQVKFVSNSTSNGVTTFQYSISCCYNVTVDDGKPNTCTLSLTKAPSLPAPRVAFAEDTLAHVAIGCSGGIVLMVGVVFALGAICNKDQRAQRKYKEDDAEKRQNKMEQPRQDTPRRPALDGVFDAGQQPGSRPSHNNPRANNMAGPREQSYRPPYDHPRRQDYDNGYDNRSFQGDEHGYALPREHHRNHPQEQMRRHTEAPHPGPVRYDHHADAARNFNDPYDGYDRREDDRYRRYPEMPQNGRDMRMGPPGDFDRY